MFLLVSSCYTHHAHTFLPFQFCSQSILKILGLFLHTAGSGAHTTIASNCKLTGILLGCCSRISLTSSTLCSVGQTNRLGLMGMYNQTKRLAGQQYQQELIKHQWGQRHQTQTHEQSHLKRKEKKEIQSKHILHTPLSVDAFGDHVIKVLSWCNYNLWLNSFVDLFSHIPV